MKIKELWSAGAVKISVSNSQYFGSYSRNVPISDKPILIFYMYFHNSFIPSVTYLFSPGEKIKSNIEVKLYKMCLTDQGQSVSEKYTCHNGHIPLIWQKYYKLYLILYIEHTTQVTWGKLSIKVNQLGTRVIRQ